MLDGGCGAQAQDDDEPEERRGPLVSDFRSPGHASEAPATPERVGRPAAELSAVRPPELKTYLFWASEKKHCSCVSDAG
eukprot:scaffold257430_cov21-Tisochrysis_lutea.AAC.1